ncbi:hypothetical protein KC19_VG102500 [Ceratodon purpureus]|uniref:Uncharacterized protein n=1 Tax=Ceratodon purpureus TaxID=3225 RepID=A0A8T0HNX1_CERPU|nr:hypothetical protein KC19_VG102500 [Ceratodon purpureus]
MADVDCRARASFFMRCLGTRKYVCTQNLRHDFRKLFALAPAQYPCRVLVPQVPAVLSCPEAPLATPRARFRLRQEVTLLAQSNCLCSPRLYYPLLSEPNPQSMPSTSNLLNTGILTVNALVHEPQFSPSLLRCAFYTPILKLHFPPSPRASRTPLKRMSHSLMAAAPHDNGYSDRKEVNCKQFKTKPQPRTQASKDPLRRIRGIFACLRVREP